MADNRMLEETQQRKKVIDAAKSIARHVSKACEKQIEIKAKSISIFGAIAPSAISTDLDGLCQSFLQDLGEDSYTKTYTLDQMNQRLRIALRFLHELADKADLLKDDSLQRMIKGANGETLLNMYKEAAVDLIKLTEMERKDLTSLGERARLLNKSMSVALPVMGGNGSNKRFSLKDLIERLAEKFHIDINSHLEITMQK